MQWLIAVHRIRGFSPSVRFTVFQFTNRGLFRFFKGMLLFCSVHSYNEGRKSQISNDFFFDIGVDFRWSMGFSQSQCSIPQHLIYAWAILDQTLSTLCAKKRFSAICLNLQNHINHLCGNISATRWQKHLGVEEK